MIVVIICNTIAIVCIVVNIVLIVKSKRRVKESQEFIRQQNEMQLNKLKLREFQKTRMCSQFCKYASDKYITQEELEEHCCVCPLGDL